MTNSPALLRDRYRLLTVIGTGGFSTIYQALDTQTGQYATIKEFTDEHAEPPVTEDMREKGLAQIRREAKMLEVMAGTPGIPAMHEMFEANGTLYLVRDYLEGMTCEDYIHRFRGRLPFALGLYIMQGTLKILQAAHDKGYLHSDVSPVNIFLNRNGMLHLIDWGNAVDLSGSMEDSVVRQAVNVRYSAPEQHISGEALTPATDLYCLGASIYEALCSEPPVQAVRRLRGEQLIPPGIHASDLPAFTKDLLSDLLSLWPEDRPQSASDVLQKLDEEIRFTVTPVGTGNSSVSAQLLHEKRSRLGFLTSRRLRRPTLL